MIDDLIIIKAKITMKSTENGGRKTGFISGYRPNHVFEFIEDNLPLRTFIGDINFEEPELFQPGETKDVVIRFLKVSEIEKYINVGQKWHINEGLRNLGTGEILEILNEADKPKTRYELEKWMTENCYGFQDYSINGNSIYEGFGIEQVNGIFNWFFTERGQKNIKKVFNNEQDIIEFAFNHIKSNKWAKSHCIGFEFDKSKIETLKVKLEALNIEYFEDKIPYYGPQKPAYRIFIFGCDIKRTEQLKNEYYNPPK